MRVALIAVACAAGCWTNNVPGPASWRTTPVAEVLPDGAWLVAALDLELDSPKQKELEARARRDPKSVHNGKGGCTFPSTHFALGMYDDDAVVVASRGGYHRTALLECIAGAAGDREVRRTSVDGLPAIELHSSEGTFALTATDHGMVVGASSVSLLTRTVAARATVLADPKLAALVRDARGRGELWIAARVPQGSPSIASALRTLGIDVHGRIVAIVGAINFKGRIDLLLDVDRGAADLAVALEQRRSMLSKLVDADLAPLVDAIRVTADGNTVRIAGSLSTGLDGMKVFMGLVRTVATLTGKLSDR